MLSAVRDGFASSLGSQHFVRRQVGPHPCWSCSFVATSCLASLRPAAAALTVARSEFPRSQDRAAIPASPSFRSLAPAAFLPLPAPSGRTLLPSPPPGGNLAHIAFCEGLRSCLRRRFQRAPGRCAAVPSTCRLTRRSSGPAGSRLLLRSAPARPAADLDSLGVAAEAPCPSQEVVATWLVWLFLLQLQARSRRHLTRRQRHRRERR